MNLTSRFSILATLAACSLFFAFPAVAAETYSQHEAARKGFIGTLYSAGKLLVNGRVWRPNSRRNIEDCTVIQTYNKPAVIYLAQRGTVTIDPDSKVQVCLHDNQLVTLNIITGGGKVRNLAGLTQDQLLRTATDWLSAFGIDSVGQLPYLSAFGFANFPATGGNGGGSGGGSNGTLSTGTNPLPTPPSP